MARRKLHLSPALSVPLDAVTHTFGIFGQKGSGKSSTAALFVEQGVAVGGRFVVADPTGVWWGLMHDGVGPGLPGIVFGGEHADVPLEKTAGHVVAEFVVQQDEYPVVVLDMKLLRKADRTTFMLAFMETLYHDNREALHVVLDESWQFAPTKAMEGGETIKLLGAVEDVVALGRARGLGITMISQRMATLNANVREQIGTLIAHRLVGALDRKALKGWIEAQADPAREKEVMEVQAKLKDATALVWSPAFLDYFGVVQVNAPQTFDSRATPKVGQRVKKPGKRAPVDLNTLREKMAATIQEHEANDPKKLREALRQAQAKLTAALRDNESRPTVEEGRDMQSEIARLEAELKEATGVPVVSDKQIKEIERLIVRAEKAAQNTTDSWESVRGVLYPLAANVKGALQAQQFPRTRPAVSPRLGDASRRQPEPQASRNSSPVARPVPEASPEPAASGGASDNGTVSAPAQKVLNAIAWYEALGNAAPSRIQIGLVAGYKVGKKGGGYFANLLGSMRTSGWIDYPSSGVVALTGSGRSLAHDPELPLEQRAFQDAVCALLSAPQEKVVRALIDAYPGALDRIELGRRTGYTVTEKGGGYFANLLGSIRTLGLIDYPDSGLVSATEVLFPL